MSAPLPLGLRPNYKAFAGQCTERLVALDRENGAATVDEVREIWRALHDLAIALDEQYELKGET